MDRPVLILGAGINGAAIARELILNHVPVCLVDIADIASGTTAASSRLIHGGLRYLEYGEFDLVRESLEERTRLLRLAPGYVRPLRLFIPIEKRFSGFFQAFRRFFGGSSPTSKGRSPRGLWLTRIGLWLYDRMMRDGSLPHRASHALPSSEVPPMDASVYRWACSYYDAQIQFPEQFVVALLQDAHEYACENDVPFQVLPYHEATLNRAEVLIRPISSTTGETLNPAAIINATGAWVDSTLRKLDVNSSRLIGGTKGSHLVTSHQKLRENLSGRGIYAEAEDGRPVFLLPLGATTLIGTTDLPFEGDPREAAASDAEIEYLIAAVNRVFPEINFHHDDVMFHYCGVRPLPYTDDETPAAISRSHSIQKHDEADVPFFSIVGGKLTTCRSLAEETVAVLFEELGREVRQTSRDREVPQLIPTGEHDVRQVIRQQWVTHLSDLVERRLMLLFGGEELSENRLRDLARILVEEDVINESDVAFEIDNCTQQLKSRYGITVRTS